MKARQLQNLGYPKSLARLAKWTAAQAVAAGRSPQAVKDALAVLPADPEGYREDEHFGELARMMSQERRAAANARKPSERAVRSEPVSCAQWGEDLDPKALEQMRNACLLPVAWRGALMPDAHLGYGLPVGGVLATRDAVIPYAVGVDIGCRMKLSVLDLPPKALQSQRDRLVGAIETETRFGMGASFSGRKGSGGRGGVARGRLRDHPVMDEDWSVSPITRQGRDKAHTQLGTSGSGNHFVEFGEFTVASDDAGALGLGGAGPWLALLSHSGSRGVGASVCDHYSRLAMQMHPELPKTMRYLAWLDLDQHEGREYWEAMNLMGRYAAANHHCIHDAIARHLGAQIVCNVENHHNFAWKQRHDDQDVIVHRKGATPADAGVMGIIPGSMASPCYMVRGRGDETSLRSASHGAGRVMSRRQAKLSYRWSHVRRLLEERGVEVLSAGIDENPHVYKDIDAVMAAQKDLVEVVARFDPRLVKMAPEGEKAED